MILTRKARVMISRTWIGAGWWLVVTATIGAQESASSRLVGRVSSGWNYYSEGASLSPQLQSLTNYATLTYRGFDAEGIRWQVRADVYQKTGLIVTTTKNPNDKFRNRNIVRQLYASASVRRGEIKIGRLVPVGTHVDAYPINGACAENLALSRQWRVSAFGGKINDEYANRWEGLGYNAGGSVVWDANRWMVGVGVTAEQLRNTRLTKGYVFGEWRPATGWRVTTRNQYTFRPSLIGYSQNTLYGRLRSTASVRVYIEYHDRRVYAPAPTDSLDWNRFFQTRREVIVGGSLRNRVWENRRIGRVEVVPEIRKRFGNGDLWYAAMSVRYRNFVWSAFDVGTTASYTQNQWLQNVKTTLTWSKDFVGGRLTGQVTGVLNRYTWRNDGAKPKTLSLISTDIDYRLNRAWHASVGVYEEFGNSTDSHTGTNVRVSYALR